MPFACHIAISSCLTLTVLATAALAQQPFDPLPAVDLSKLSPADFTDDELDCPDGGNNASHPMPYLLAHFKQFADAVSDGTGELPRGYIGISVWRGEHDNKPHNMRIMENNLSLAYFYATDRPWNVYRGHPALRQRLEAVFEFMIKEQGPGGQFSEYAPQKWGLAPTAFGTKFLAQTLTLLKRPGAPPIDPALLARVIAMDRKAILFILEDGDFYKHGMRFTNQFGNVWAGGLGYLSVFPDDAELRQKLEAKYAASDKDFFSPAGYPFENDGSDWSYNLGTHASNQRMVRFYTRGKPGAFGAQSLDEERRFFEWVAYNAVPVPGSATGFVLNRAIECRGDVAYRGGIESNFADELEVVRAFAPTDEEVAARRAKCRRELERTWPSVEPLRVGDFRAFPPYDFLHREHHATHPTAAQREAARKLLPYFARETFTHQRVDGRRDPAPTYTFLRRPTYYAAFNSGNQRNNQRLGLGLLWNPQLGALIQSQTGSAQHAWGTHHTIASDGDDRGDLYEAHDVVADFTAGGEAVRPSVGVRDLPAGDVVIGYALGAAGGRKEVRFFADRIEVHVTHPGEFREQIPLLLLPDDTLSTDGTVTLRRGTGALRIEPAGAAGVTRVDDDKGRVGPYRMSSVHLAAKDQLAYTIRVSMP
jgi:hypothetical protein